MSKSLRAADHETYIAIGAAEDEDGSTSETLAADDIELLERKRPVGSTREVAQASSLSRNERHFWYFMGHGAADAVLTLGPVLFLVVPGMCLGLNGQPVSTYGETVKAITLLAPTIFPIIYAAILGKLLRRIGLFRAERGTTLGSLERLIGCQSIFSTLERQFCLWTFDTLGVSILLAWLLSPLGGQASLRLLSTNVIVSTSNSTVSYFPFWGYPQESCIKSADEAQKSWPLYGPLFMTAVQTSRQSLVAPMDLFGHIKIPDIKYLVHNNNNVTISDYEWHDVDNTTITNYTSILGVPIVNVPDSGSCSFRLISHYWAIDCQTLEKLPEPPVWPPAPASGTNRTTGGANLSTFHIRVDESKSTHGNVSFEYLSKGQFMYLKGPEGTIMTTEDVVITSALCSAAPVVVESGVRCHDRSCAVRAVRKVKIDPVETWMNSTGTRPSPLSVFRNISEWMPGADIGLTQGIASTSELIELWMVNTDLSTLGTLPYVDFVMQLGLTNFTRRLQTAINTFWDASLGSGVRLNQFQRGVGSTTWTETDIVVSKNEGDAYVCNTGLAILTIVISLVLFLAANISLLLGLVTRTPDILGFVSSSASNNPYFKRHIASTLGGLETSKALRDVKVKIGDVKSEEPIGHIALATIDMQPKKLSWTRLYD